MPGRDDLLQQNRAAVRARVESAGDQASAGGQKPIYPSHRSLLGGNLDVASALESIEFSNQGPLGDGSLRNSVAYIRYWTRAGARTTAEASSQTIDATQIDPGTDPQSELSRAINERYGFEREEAQSIEYTDDLSAAKVVTQDGVIEYVSAEVLDSIGGRVIQTNVDTNTLIRDEDGNIIEGFSETRFAKYNEQLSVDPTQQKERQSALSSQIPKVKDSEGDGANTLVANSSQINVQPTTDGSNRNNRSLGVGQLKPANPNGFVNTLSRVGRSVLGIPPSQIGYSGQAGGAQGGKAALAPGGTLSQGMWQFLFNPSELEIEAGPEFKAAETWGVSDKGNSGQPLHWSHNKNSQLKFNSVLLNGYVFGRKVEELEQGIFELFMARDGEGQAGPPILEFVWGKRVFGPCVIRDISVKEKMWDEGMVVNAELSFTLEQIPEWVINDGYVDIARPSKVPPIGDVTAPSGSETPTTTQDAPPGSEGAAAPTANPGQKGGGTQDPSTSGSAYRTCQKAYELAEVFSQIEISGNNAKSVPGQASIVNELFKKYEAAYAQGNSSVGVNFINRVPAQQKPPSIFKSLRAMFGSPNPSYITGIDLIRNAALRCKAAMENVWNNDCKKLIEDGKKAQTAAASANNTQALCNGITVGKPCNIGPGAFSPKNPCSNKVLRCNGRGVYEEI
jgi:hypothetical protein